MIRRAFLFAGLVACANCTAKPGGAQPSRSTESEDGSTGDLDMPRSPPTSMDAAAVTQPDGPGAPDAGSRPDTADAGSAFGVPDAFRNGDTGSLPDASSLPVDPPGFAAIQPGQGATVSTPKGKWSLEAATGTCKAPYTAGSHSLYDGKQAGSTSLCFVQLVANTTTGQAYAQDGLKLWWRWNGVDQWTPEVTGDPRNPTKPPPLGKSTLYGSTFEDGKSTNWYAEGLLGACYDYKNGTILRTAGWVQSFCKHKAVKPDQSATDVQKGRGTQMLKFYVGKNTSMAVALPYTGEVDPSYPAPDCRQ